MSLRLEKIAVAKREKLRPLALVSGGPQNGLVACFDERGNPADGVISLSLSDDSYFIPWPEEREHQRDVFHICGPSGVGKSTLAAKLVSIFRLVHGDECPVYLVTSGEVEDPAYEDVGEIFLLPIEEALGDMQLSQLGDLEQRKIVIFDDVEGVHDKLKVKALNSFQQRCLETGRKAHLTVINLFHKGASGAATRESLSEATAVGWFPGSAAGNMAYMLKRYVAIPDELRLAFKKPGWGRYVLAFTKGHPSYIVSEKRCALYDEDACVKAAKQVAKEAAANDGEPAGEAPVPLRRRPTQTARLREALQQ